MLRNWTLLSLAGLIILAAGTRRTCAMSRQTERQGRAPAVQVVTDETGRRVPLPARVNRIVSLAPNLTETIYALHVDEKLVGDTDYCDTPPAAKSKPHVGSILSPSFEAIVALHPDLVLATANSGNRRETVDALRDLGLAVYTIDPHTVRGLLTSISHIAALADASAQGNELVSSLEGRLDALQKVLGDRDLAHVLFVVWDEPLITIGQNTLIADALRWAGAESVIVSDQDWPQISMEEVVRVQPDYIVYANDHGHGSATQLKRLRSQPAWKELHAVERGHVVTISEEVDRAAPGLIDAIEQLARELHPDAFAGTRTQAECAACGH
jgi:iron complex transport system substrate-binding protein